MRGIKDVVGNFLGVPCCHFRIVRMDDLSGRFDMTEESELDARIVASWEELESADPNISTEYLAYLVEQTTGADYRRQIEALTNAGFFARRIAEISVEDMDDET